MDPQRRRGCVRHRDRLGCRAGVVITLDADECLQGGAELLKDGIEVRVAGRQLGADSMSYHIFGSDNASPTVILNHRSGDRDRPVRIVGASPAQLFRDHFESAWLNAA